MPTLVKFRFQAQLGTYAKYLVWGLLVNVFLHHFHIGRNAHATFTRLMAQTRAVAQKPFSGLIAYKSCLGALIILSSNSKI